MTEREEVAWVVAYNLAIFATIGTITIGGLLISGEWHGLWSLLLLLATGTHKADKNKGDD